MGISVLAEVLVLCAVPVVAELVFGLFGFLRKPTPVFVSGLQHLCSGVVLAAMALEVLPLVVAKFERTRGHYIAVTIGFIFAIVCLSLLAHFFPEQCDDCCPEQAPKPPSAGCCEESTSVESSVQPCSSRDACSAVNSPSCSTANSRSPDENFPLISSSSAVGTLPWAFLIPLALDTFVDGVLLGVTYVARTRAGFVVAFAFAFETAVLGALTSAALKRRRISALVIALVSGWFCSLLTVGAVLGALVLHVVSGLWFLGFLTFGVAALLFLVVDNILVEARENPKGVNWVTKSSLYLGFLAVFVTHFAVE